MQGAGPDLFGSLQRAIPGIAVDAVPSRQFWHAAEIAAAHCEGSSSPDILVIHLGTTDAQVDEVMQVLSGAPVVIMNIRAPRDWESETNQRLARSVGRHVSATLLDWWSVTSGSQHMLNKDGLHLSRSGAETYALHVARFETQLHLTQIELQRHAPHVRATMWVAAVPFGFSVKLLLGGPGQLISSTPSGCCRVDQPEPGRGNQGVTANWRSRSTPQRSGSICRAEGHLGG